MDTCVIVLPFGSVQALKSTNENARLVSTDQSGVSKQLPRAQLAKFQGIEGADGLDNPDDTMADWVEWIDFHLRFNDIGGNCGVNFQCREPNAMVGRSHCRASQDDPNSADQSFWGDLRVANR